MPRVISSTEAKNKLGSTIEWVLENGDAVIVENHGTPAVVIISYAEYEKIGRLREQARRSELLAQLASLREEVRARNGDIADEEAADSIAEHFSRDFIDGLATGGKIHFEP